MFNLNLYKKPLLNMNKKSFKMYDILEEERDSLKGYFESFNDKFLMEYVIPKIRDFNKVGFSSIEVFYEIEKENIFEKDDIYWFNEEYIIKKLSELGLTCYLKTNKDINKYWEIDLKYISIDWKNSLSSTSFVRELKKDFNTFKLDNYSDLEEFINTNIFPCMQESNRRNKKYINYKINTKCFNFIDILTIVEIFRRNDVFVSFDFRYLENYKLFNFKEKDDSRTYLNLYISWEKKYSEYSQDTTIINSKYCTDYIEYILKEVNNDISSGMFAGLREITDGRCERYLNLNQNIFNYRNLKNFSDTYKIIRDGNEKELIGI